MARVNRYDLDYFLDHNINISTRTIIIDDEDDGIDAAKASKFLKSMHILEQKPDEPINIIITSSGGCWHSGMAIFDSIRNSPCSIQITGTGQVMSMGSIIMQAADSRILTPYTRFMIHNGTIELSESHTKIFQSWAKEEKKIQSVMEDIYLEQIRKKHPKFTRKKLQELLAFDTILSAKEAVELGLADKVK